MAVKLLCLCLLLVVLCPSWARKQKCLQSASSCEECIQSGPECAWCTAPQSNTRCHMVKGLQRAGCHSDSIYSPQSEVQVIKNESSTEPANAKALFLQPQEFSLRLRPGVSQSFHLTVTKPPDRPITELTMDSSPEPAGVNITFSNITNGNRLTVQVAAQCPSASDDSNQTQNRTGSWSVHITPRGSSLSVKLDITLDCQCDCTRNREEKSLGCSGRGALVCGQCECYQPYTGQRCQRDIDSVSANEDACRSGPNAPVCSGRGGCVDGFCECENQENPIERFSGRFCECSNFDCPYHRTRICGGHGKCECGQCICDAKWTGVDCSCSLETASCLATNKLLCNGRGNCQCGTCICMPPFTGPTCEHCPTCPGACQEHRECVECRAFGTGEKKDRCDQECSYLTMTMVETRQDLPEPGNTVLHCTTRSHDDDCFFYYTFSVTPSGRHATVVRTKHCPPVMWK